MLMHEKTCVIPIVVYRFTGKFMTSITTLLLPRCFQVLCLVLVGYAVLCVLSSFAFILVGKRELIALLHRGSYMSAHGLLNLLIELRKRDKMRGFLAEHFIYFSQRV